MKLIKLNNITINCIKTNTVEMECLLKWYHSYNYIIHIYQIKQNHVILDRNEWCFK
jgi:hypothetical protein